MQFFNQIFFKIFLKHILTTCKTSEYKKIFLGKKNRKAPKEDAF